VHLGAGKQIACDDDLSLGIDVSEMDAASKYFCGYCMPAARKYCKSTNRSAAGNGALMFPASSMNAIT